MDSVTLAAASDRRKAPRFERGTTVAVRDLEEDFVALLPRLRDISAVGIGLYTGNYIPPGRLMEFHLQLPSAVITGSATVRWSCRDPDGFRTGLAFENMSNSDRVLLLDYLAENSPNTVFGRVGSLVSGATLSLPSKMGLTLLIFAAVEFALDSIGIAFFGPEDLFRTLHELVQ